MHQDLGFYEIAHQEVEAPIWVHLPGMDCTGRLFGVQTEHIAKRFHLHILYLTNQNRDSLSQLAERVITHIKDLLGKSNQNRVILSGESFGGCLALQIGILAQDLLDQVILLNPGTAAQLNPFFKVSSPLVSFIPNRGFGLEKIFLKVLARTDRMSKQDLETMLKTVETYDNAAIRWRMKQVMRFTSSKDQLNHVEVPFLILASTKDRLLPSVKEANRLQSILKNSRVHHLVDSGHAAFLEQEINLLDLWENH